MPVKRSAILLPLVLSLALIGCDSRDYEGEIAELQSELEAARSELETARTENETLSGEMEQLRGQAGGGAVNEETLQSARQQLNTALQAASRTIERIGQPGGSPQQQTQALGGVREDVQLIIASLRTAGQQLGMELEQPAGAAGQGAQPGQAQQPGATPPTGQQPPAQPQPPQQQ